MFLNILLKKQTVFWICFFRQKVYVCVCVCVIATKARTIRRVCMLEFSLPKHTQRESKFGLWDLLACVLLTCVRKSSRFWASNNELILGVCDRIACLKLRTCAHTAAAQKSLTKNHLLYFTTKLVGILKKHKLSRIV